MYLEPGNHLWMDAWIPRDDPLWSYDVSVAAEWVGRWWVQALSASGGPTGAAFSIHAGRSVAGRLGGLVCFAGRGPGEVFEGDRKVVGLSQWRSREGALFSSCAYTSWDPEPLLELLDFAEGERVELAAELGGVRGRPAPIVDAGDGSLAGARAARGFVQRLQSGAGQRPNQAVRSTGPCSGPGQRRSAPFSASRRGHRLASVPSCLSLPAVPAAGALSPRPRPSERTLDGGAGRAGVVFGLRWCQVVVWWGEKGVKWREVE